MYGQNVYVIGGISVGIDVIHTTNDTISKNVSHLVTEVHNAATVIANSKIYVFGGNTEPYAPWSLIDTYQYASLPTQPTSMYTKVFMVRTSNLFLI